MSRLGSLLRKVVQLTRIKDEAPRRSGGEAPSLWAIFVIF